MPRTGLYARGIQADIEGRWSESFTLYDKAVKRYRQLLVRRPNDRFVRGWLLKAVFQREQSLRLRAPQLRLHPFSTAATLYDRAAARHAKWLAIRAFSGRAPTKLALDVERDYLRALRLGSRFHEERARLGLATLQCQRGRRRAGLRTFAGRRGPQRVWLALQQAAYYAACGNRERAVERLRRALQLSPSGRHQAYVSNDFDALRGLPAFGRVVGQIAGGHHRSP